MIIKSSGSHEIWTHEPLFKIFFNELLSFAYERHINRFLCNEFEKIMPYVTLSKQTSLLGREQHSTVVSIFASIPATPSLIYSFGVFSEQVMMFLCLSTAHCICIGQWKALLSWSNSPSTDKLQASSAKKHMPLQNQQQQPPTCSESSQTNRSPAASIFQLIHSQLPQSRGWKFKF